MHRSTRRKNVSFWKFLLTTFAAVTFTVVLLPGCGDDTVDSDSDSEFDSQFDSQTDG
jgi:hypothetical protein